MTTDCLKGCLSKTPLVILLASKIKQQSHKNTGAKKKRMLLQKELHSKLEKKNLAHLADVRFVSTVKGAQNYSILLLPKS